MEKIIVSDDFDCVRLDRFLLKSRLCISKVLTMKLCRQKKIQVNKKNCEASFRVHCGDMVEVLLPKDYSVCETGEDIAKESSNFHLNVLYEDDDIVAVYKPKGLLSQSDKRENSIDNYINEYVKNITGMKNRVGIVTRLDKNTSGIVLSAKNLRTLRILNELSKGKELTKEYLAIISGSVKDGILKTYGIKDPSCNKVIVKATPFEDSFEMITEYNTLDKNNSFSLLLCRLITGKTHQIRAQLEFMGAPVLGDKKYGNEKTKNKASSQMLSCVKLTVPKESFNKQEDIVIHSIPDEEFLKCLDKNGLKIKNSTL